MTFLLNHIFSLFITLVAIGSLLYNAHLIVVIERQKMKMNYLRGKDNDR